MQHIQKQLSSVHPVVTHYQKKLIYMYRLSVQSKDNGVDHLQCTYIQDASTCTYIQANSYYVKYTLQCEDSELPF